MNKKYLIIILSLFSLSSFSQTDYTNHYILFDITGSMIGRGNDKDGKSNVDIWDKSINLLEKQLKYFDAGDKVTLFLYGSKFYDKGMYTIDNLGNVAKKIITDIKNVNDFETCTCTYYALNEALKKLENTKNTNRIYLFTDGNPTLGCHKNCDSISPRMVMNNFDEIIKDKESDYLFIYKLKPEINIDPIVKNNSKVRIIKNPFSEIRLTVFATPYNSPIVLNQKILESTQKFTFSGTGVDEFLDKESLPVIMSDFYLSNHIENSSNQKAEFINLNNTNTINLNNITQKILLKTANHIGVFDKEKYNGEVFYTFPNKSTTYTFTSGKYRIDIEILGNKSKVIFDNRAEKPKVTIEFID